MIALQRIINHPARGIGQKTLQRLSGYASSSNKTLFQVLISAEEIDTLGKVAAKNVKEFGEWIADIRKTATRENLYKIGERLLRESKLVDFYQKEDETQALNRIENLNELLNALREYSYASDRSAIDDLENFLQEVALVTDIDRWDPEEQAVNLMTLHSAKGLEFPIVFITGLEDGLFPLKSYIDENMDLEEERRLFYVGATRARDQLFLTYARNRRRWGQEVSWQKLSRFVNEIAEDLIEKNDLAVNDQIYTERLAFKDSTRSEFPMRSKRLNGGDSFNLGCRVAHSTFGEGMIMQKEGSGEDLRLLVNFENVGAKLLLASYAKLKIISD
jgi:DNA helicase-2/ATP-dependent DNA helicase PcrA